jgi:hypothetical protein
MSRAAFVSDHGSVARWGGGRQIAWDRVGEQYRRVPGARVVVGGAGAAQGAVAIPLAAPLAIPLAAGLLLDFGGVKRARVAAGGYAAGAANIPVDALPAALAAADVAVVRGEGPKQLKASTVVSQQADGRVFPRADADIVAVPTETAHGVLETNADEGSQSDALTGYGVFNGGGMFETLMVDATGGPPKVLPAAWKNELNAAGTGFAFEQYSDNRAG